MSDEKKSYQVTDRRHSSVASHENEPEEHPSEATAPPPETATHEEAGGVPPVDFITFILSLATQAGMLLEGPEGGRPDLLGAQWMISIIEMLRDKTEGRRTAAETEALDRILYELRLAYVERAKVGGA